MPVDRRPVARALLSVSDKSGLVEFAAALAACGIELISTGGTRKALADAGLNVRDVADVTQFPEMMDGRVKTLHPRIHGGLLAVRENPEHEAAMLAHGIAPLDLLVVNLYPFETTLALRRRLAQKAFARTAAYDAEISNWLAEEIGEPAPPWRALGGRLAQEMRYGENPHQRAGFYLAGP